MVRILISYIIPLLLPTIIYFIWTAWVRRQVEANHAALKAAASAAASDGTGEAGDIISDEELAAFDIPTPWFRLILAGAGLVVVSLILSFFLSPKNPPQSVYQPPRVENGQVVPGQYVPKPTAPQQN